jgi:hypothetical protein
MNPMFRAFMCVLALSSLGMHAQAQEVSVTGKEIQDNWVGKTLLGTAANGAPVTMVLSADGTATLSAGSTNDFGTWRAAENGYCTTWKTIRAGQERCFTTRRSGSKVTVLNPDGSVSGQFHEIK